MYDIVIVHKLNGVANLSSHSSYYLFRKPPFLFQKRIKVSSATRLQNQIKKLLIIEKPIKLGYIRVIKKALDFDLSNELIDKLTLALKNFLWNFLQSKDKFCLNMP